MVPALAAVSITVASIGLVALASMRRAPHRQSGSGVPGLLKNLGVALVIVYVAIAIYVVLAGGMRRAKSETERSRSDWASMVGLVVFVLLVSWVFAKFRRPDAVKPPQAVGSAPPPRDAVPPLKVTPDQPVTWGWKLGIAVVVAIAVVSVVLALRERRGRVAPSDLPDRRTLVAESLNDVLSELEAEHDPRRAVLLADRGMEVALAEHGLPRVHTETANEYASRVAADLSLSNESAQTLTHLYSLAHFSPRELAEDDRRSAIDALSAVRDELRTMPTADANR